MEVIVGNAMKSLDEILKTDAITARMNTPTSSSAEPTLESTVESAMERNVEPDRDYEDDLSEDPATDSASEPALTTVQHTQPRGTLAAPRSTTPLLDETCPRCGGVGFVVLDVPMSDPDFGKAVPCAC